jgi:predicted permease
MLRRFWSLCRALLLRRRFEDGMREEMRFHLEQYERDLVRGGLPADEAAWRARREFGSLDNAKDDCREARGLRLVDELQRDVRYAVRLLRKTPAFTLTALATLALCLGANLTIFAVVDSVLLRPLPFPDADRLVRVFNTYPKAAVLDDGASVANYYERRGHIPAFASLSLYRQATSIVGDAGTTEREEITLVSPDFFVTLGIAPVMGRAFTDEEMTYQNSHVVILSDAYWRQRFNADPNVIGRPIRVSGDDAWHVVGVLPPGFSLLSSTARLYVPLASDPDRRLSRERHSGSSSHMIARLAPGTTLEQAQSQIDAHNAVMEQDDPQAAMMADAGFRSLVVPLHADHVAAIRPMLLLLQAGALFLLLIGAVNLVNLLLIRASGRVKELAVRQAIGASRRHIVSEVLVETTVLTLAGGLLGLAAGAGGIQLLAALGADRLPLGAHIAFDARVAAIALAGAIVMGIAIGIPIAWYNLRGHAGHGHGLALQSETRGGTAGRAAQRLRHAFVVAQMALAFVLLAGTGLLGLSLKQVMAISPGFRPEHVLSGQIALPGKTYPTGASRLAFTERLVTELERQPGVLAAGIVTNVPLSGRNIKSAATVKGYRPPAGQSVRGHYSYFVTGDYFAAMGFSLIDGRFLTTADSRRTERVCVVDEDFARHYFPRGGAIGQHLFAGSQEGKEADAFTIVGIVGAVKQAELTDGEAQGAIFYPYAYNTDDVFVVTRTSVQPEAFATALRTVVRGVDSDMPVNDVQSMDSRIADSLVTRRSPALLAGFFSAIAVLLTAIGTYGVLSYAVAQRRREIGLRMALGARPEQVRAQFLALALRLLAGGILLGLGGAWLTGRAMQAILFHVPAVHLATLAGTAIVMGAVCLAACLLPSRRAARISPMEALTEE